MPTLETEMENNSAVYTKCYKIQAITSSSLHAERSRVGVATITGLYARNSAKFWGGSYILVPLRAYGQLMSVIGLPDSDLKQ